MLDTFSQPVSPTGMVLSTGWFYTRIHKKQRGETRPAARRQIKDLPPDNSPSWWQTGGTPAPGGTCLLPPRLHPGLPGQENRRPPPWRRPRRCPINRHWFPVHLPRSRERASLIIAASSALLARRAKKKKKKKKNSSCLHLCSKSKFRSSNDKGEEKWVLNKKIETFFCSDGFLKFAFITVISKTSVIIL